MHLWALVWPADAPGRGFGPAADSLSLRVQRKEAKKAPGMQHPRLVGCVSLAALEPVVTRCSRKGLLDSPRPFTDTGARPASRWTTSRRTCAGAAACRWLVVQRDQATVRLGGERSWTVERGFARTVTTAGRSAAQRGDRSPPTSRGCCIPGAFFASFLCTSKERKSAAGPKPPPGACAGQPKARRRTSEGRQCAESRNRVPARPAAYRCTLTTTPLRSITLSRGAAAVRS